MNTTSVEIELEFVDPFLDPLWDCGYNGDPDYLEVFNFRVEDNNATSRSSWIKDLEQKGVRIGGCAKDLLLSEDFSLTDDVGKGDMIAISPACFVDHDPFSCVHKVQGIYEGMIGYLKLFYPNTGISRLIFEQLMGCMNEDDWWNGVSSFVIMHQPITDTEGIPRLLCLTRDYHGYYIWAVRIDSLKQYPVGHLVFGFSHYSI